VRGNASACFSPSGECCLLQIMTCNVVRQSGSEVNACVVGAGAFGSWP
jgi:hypothetical protein